MQLGAVTRRVHKNGTRQKQDTTKKEITLPTRLVKLKRRHKFAEALENKQAICKKVWAHNDQQHHVSVKKQRWKSTGWREEEKDK